MGCLRSMIWVVCSMGNGVTAVTIYTVSPMTYMSYLVIALRRLRACFLPYMYNGNILCCNKWVMGKGNYWIFTWFAQIMYCIIRSTIKCARLSNQAVM